MLYKTQQLDGTLLSTTYYFYNGIGNPTNVVTELETPLGGAPKYRATRFIYAANAQTVTFMLGETWDLGSCYSAYNITFAREFRYDQARPRYLDRELSPAGLEIGTMVTLSETWTDYDGNNVYGDFTVTSGDPPMQAKQYEPGIGTIDDPAGSPVSKYLHNDHLGTLRTATTSTSSSEQLRVFTAFGEPVTNTPQTSTDRYGYVGSWGYQSNVDTSSLHVGARYYDPAIGRFLQRDPIGIQGGVNVYVYVQSAPTRSVDPSGLRIGDLDSGLKHDMDVVAFAKSPPPPRKPELSPRQELERIKGRIQTAGFSSAICAAWNPDYAIAFAISALIDQFTHLGEPVNPVFGGDYSQD